MSEASKTLKLMEEFDFKKSFTVEIFYESDDDKSPTNEIENNENNQVKDLEQILNGIIGDLTKASEKSNQIDHASSKNRRLSSESIPAKRAKVNKKVDGNEQVAETLTLEYRPENIQNNQVVTREEAQLSYINNQTLYTTQSTNDIRSQQIMTNTTCQDTSNNTRLCPEHNSYTSYTRQTSENNNNDQVIRPADEQTFNSSLSSQNSTNNSIHPLTSLSQMIVSQNQVDLHKKASECIGTLLMTVSSHLILVMKAWTDYLQVYKSTNRRSSPEVHIAYKQYRETKYHLFYLSLAVVKNTLLPKENDHVFIKTFIEYTLDIARSRNIDVTYQDMTTVLNELFAWVKSYKHPLLNELLRPPAQPHAQGHTYNRSKEHQGWQCDSTYNASNVRFRSELPCGDSAMNVNSSAMGLIQPFQNVNTPVQSLTYYETLVQHRRAEPQSLANPPSYVEEMSFTRQEQQNLFRGVTENSKNNAGKKKRGPKQKHPVELVQEVQTRTLPPPSYEDSTSAQRNFSENHLISSANYYSFQPETQAYEVNRSLSRDSGIVSPRSPANDLNYTSMVLTPMITHVTSLNPSATQIKDGLCLLCGTSTKHMCRGCYKTYYCSNQCQISDWMRHIGFCKANISTT